MTKLFFYNTKTRYLLVCLLLISVSSCLDSKKKPLTVENPLAQLDALYKTDLISCISYLDTLNFATTQEQALDSYLKSRKFFKKIEPVLAFTDPENYKTLNQPNILKIEEEDATDIKRNEPFGFQVIEELLFEEPINLEAVKTIANKTKQRLKLISKNSNLKLKAYHILWLIRDEITRIALTGITGFDSPVLEQSLKDAITAYQSMKSILDIYDIHFKAANLHQSWNSEIENTITFLQSNFNAFNRYDFIKTHTHKQLELIVETREDWSVDFPYELAFKNNMVSLFSKKAFNMNHFSETKEDSSSITEKVALGKKLFYEKAFSKDNTISCSSCHQLEKYFTDGKKISDGVTRNSPTLLYAALQQSFFYDNREGSLEGQIVSVVTSENEFHTDLKHLEAVVKNNQKYHREFTAIYKRGVFQDNIRNAIASYIRSLTPFNSKFDKNINNEEESLTKSEINGFNLFAGKAKCASCHFPPLFNGTVPIQYKESEMELIGVPKTNDTVNAIIDNDLGRYNLFHTDERKHFFKTPSIRNIEKTGPYMHNGVFTSLEEVIDFYNRGGGIGLGMNLEHQTLPAQKLNLDHQEVLDIIAFMKTLNDSIF